MSNEGEYLELVNDLRDLKQIEEMNLKPSKKKLKLKGILKKSSYKGVV